jgi:FkbM family methyltransferase
MSGNVGSGAMARLNERLVYDIGLHKGEDTDFYLKKGFSVIAFEANPSLIEYCKARFQDAVREGRLHIIAGAIAPDNSDDNVKFFLNRERPQWGTIDETWVTRNDNLGYKSDIISVKRIDILDIFESFDIPEYLKIDVEGADKLVLEALRKIESRPRYISIESEKRDFAILEAEFNLFDTLGYTKFKVLQQKNIPGSMIMTKTLDGRQLSHVFEEHASGPFGDEIPQPWLSRDDALREYAAIFRRYRLFGDETVYETLPRRVRRFIEILYKSTSGYRGPFPGWFDTHATL